MKSSADALKSSYGRRRWRVALERRQRDGSLALRDYLEMLRPTAQTLTEALCAVDLAGRIQLVNPSAQRLLGCAEPDLLGRSIHEVLCCSTQVIRDGAARGVTGLGDALALHANVELDPCELRAVSGASIPVRCALRSITHAGHTLGAMLTMLAVAGPASRQPLDTGETFDSERRMGILEVVGDIALAQLPLDDLLSALLDALCHEMSLENAAIFLVNDEGDMVIARAASGAGAESADSIRVPLGQGVIGEAMRTRRPLFLSEISPTAPHSDEFSPELRASMNVQSLVMMPLIVEERVIGVLYLGASEPHRFTQEDARLVELVGERVALAIERAHASDEAARAHERLRFLNDASGALNATLNYHDTTQRLAAIATPALADACAVYLLEDDGLLRKVAAQAPARSLLTADPTGVAFQRLVERLDASVEVNPDDTSSAIGRCIQSLTPVFERYPVTPVSQVDDDAAGTEAPGCLCVCAPLVVRQHAVGALYLAIRPGKKFADGDLALILGLAERAAIAIDNARLYIETQQALASGSATATQLDTIFNATDVGIFVTNANGAFLRINPYGAHLLGIPVDALERGYTGANAPFELRTPEGEPIPLDRDPLHLARTQGRAIEQRVIIHLHSSGKDIQALTRCSPWLNERRQIAGAIGVVTDITAIYELERQKDEFLGIASHELKTPLTSLKILAQLLARKMQASGELRELEQAQRMQVAITRMERLIRDLLDVTLIQEGKLALHEELTDLGDICAEAVGEQAVLSQRTIQFTPPEQDSLLVHVDRERIYQVISNLLSNALKYSPATTQVVVRTRATERECIVSVQDHGPGVPPEAVEHIFDRFYRVPGMQVQSGSGVGLGLGLHISKDIVERHGGSIWVESKLGHGSVFSIALPRASA